MFKVVVAAVFVFNIIMGIGATIVMKSGVGSSGACIIGMVAAFIALTAATVAATLVDEMFP